MPPVLLFLLPLLAAAANNDFYNIGGGSGANAPSYVAPIDIEELLAQQNHKDSSNPRTETGKSIKGSDTDAVNQEWVRLIPSNDSAQAKSGRYGYNPYNYYGYNSNLRPYVEPYKAPSKPVTVPKTTTEDSATTTTTTTEDPTTTTTSTTTTTDEPTTTTYPPTYSHQPIIIRPHIVISPQIFMPPIYGSQSYDGLSDDCCCCCCCCC